MSLGRVLVGILGGLLTAALALAVWAAIDGVPFGRALVWFASPNYEAASESAAPPAADPEVAQDIAVELDEVAKGFARPTDMQFPPGDPQHALVLEKDGQGKWLKRASGVHGRLLNIAVLTASEEGLLGAAFHPRYADNGRVFLHYVADVGGKHMSRVEEWRFDPPRDLSAARASAVRTVLEVEQPYQNHNGGALVFGPDGYLYIGYGDGGFRDDPHDHGQTPSTWLGSMLRIDIDVEQSGDRRPAYTVPKDNPFLGRAGYAPETFAYGLRNPWRYSFDPSGRLIVADVGQDRWEEIHIVQAGDNLGWKVREGLACAEKGVDNCPLAGAVDPIYVYDRSMGASITGGHVYLGQAIVALRGKYVFGDFVTGRLLAIDLPADRSKRVPKALSLGRFRMLLSALSRDPQGELYALSFGDGRILRLAPKANTK